MKRFKLLAVLLAALMVCSVMPLAAAAEEIGYVAHENYMFGLLTQVWNKLDAVEAEAIAAGASPAEVTMAVYRAVLTEPLVDEDSITDLTDGGFFFRVNDMAAGYNYKSRNVKIVPNVTEDIIEDVVEYSNRNGNTNTGILLVGPYYGYDSSFTNQYRQEAESLAAHTEGTLVRLEGQQASGLAICAAAVNAGVVIYDSHGTAGNGTSYLCLKTNAGITSTDLQNNWAYSSGSSDAGIDGRYVQNHIEGELPNTLFWMAICEGMKLSGHGVTGTALLAAGAGVVYGYSQSVTFAGDYVYEATFWNHMKAGETVAESFSAMVAAHGVRDPYGDAYPIVMSPDDPFPANPDSAQTVHSDWQLLTQSDMVVTDATSLTFEQASYGVAPTFTTKLVPVIAPEGANNFTSTWTSSNPDVAIVSPKGVVTGINPGRTVVTLTIQSTPKSESEYTFTASVDVIVSNEYLPADVMYVPTDIIVPGEHYLIGVKANGRTVVMDNTYYDANHTRNLVAVNVNETELGGVTCILEGVDAGNEWIFSSADGGMVVSAETGEYLTMTGNYLTVGDAGIEWNWTELENTGYVLMNNASAYFKYLATNTSCAYFGAFIQPVEIQLYRKLERESSPITQIPGDLDGDGMLTANDALVLLRFSIGAVDLTPAQMAVADANGDGSVNANDALYVLRAALGVF